jgi:DNA-binding beta-propeller fold protein YncE
VFDAKSDKLVGSIVVAPETLSSLAFNADGTLLFAVDTVANSVLVFDTTANNAQIASVPTGATTDGYYPGVVLSPDGRELYYTSDTGLRVVTVLPATSASTPGAPVGNVIIGAFGTRYQVMADVDPQTLEPNGSTRVSILDKDGRVITTSQDIAGIPTSALPVKRPDGSLLVATYDEATNTTTITAVSTSGVATTAGSLTGSATSQILIASNGAAFLMTDVDGTGSAYRLLRVSTANVSQTYTIDGSPSGLAPKLAPNGSAYVAYQDGDGLVSVLAVDANGSSTTTPVGIGVSSPGPVTISSDSKAYVAVSMLNDQGTATVTKMLTFTGTESTVREIPGLRLGVAIANARGSVFQTTVDPVTNRTYASTLTATTLKTSSAIAGLGEGQPVVAADGTTYVIVNTGQGYGLGIANARGQTRVVPINGQIAQAIDNVGGLALTVGYDRKAYVAYVDSNNRYHVAIITASGGTTIKDMPLGTTTKHRVYFTIRGVAAHMVQTTDPNTGAISTSAIILSSGARTEQIPGELVAGTIDLKGNGYIVTSAENAAGDLEVTVLAFTSAAKTIAKITAPGGIVVAVDNLAGPFGATPVVLAPDGTAYVTLSAGLDNSSSGAEVWAIKSTGKTKVLDVDTSLVSAVTVQRDGTAYVTVSEIDENTGQYVSTVRVISSPVV